MASLRQNLANQRNAQSSTGPKTREGKAASRANSFKHGLRSEGVVLNLDQEEKFEQRLESWRPGYENVLKESGDDAEVLFEEMVFSSILMEESRGRRFDLVAKTKERAILNWDADRKLLAEDIAEDLHARPSRTVAKLKTFLQGAEWLIAMGKDLRGVLQAGNGLTKGQNQLLDDLLGIDPRMRYAPRTADQEEAETFVDGFLAGFNEQMMDNLETLDFEEQAAAAERGFTSDTNRETLLAVRYSNAALRRFRWSRKELKALRGESCSSETEEAIEPAAIADAAVVSQDPELEVVDVEPETEIDEEVEEDEAAEPRKTFSIVAPNEPSGDLGNMGRYGSAEPTYDDRLHASRLLG